MLDLKVVSFPSWSRQYGGCYFGNLGEVTSFVTFIQKSRNLVKILKSFFFFLFMNHLLCMRYELGWWYCSFMNYTLILLCHI